MIRAPARYIGIIARRHQGRGRRLSHAPWKLGRHGLYRRPSDIFRQRASAPWKRRYWNRTSPPVPFGLRHCRSDMHSRHLLRKRLILILFRKTDQLPAHPDRLPLHPHSLPRRWMEMNSLRQIDDHACLSSALPVVGDSVTYGHLHRVSDSLPPAIRSKSFSASCCVTTTAIRS